MAKTITTRRVKSRNPETGQLETYDAMEVGGGISADGATVGQIPVADADGGVQWQTMTRHLPVNSEDAVTKIGNVAMSYILNHNDFVYGGQYSAIRDECKPDPETGKWQIACSIFAMLVLYGISYENSAYQRGSGNNIMDPDCCTDLEMWEWFKTKWPDKTGDYQYKYSFDLGKWCCEHGYAFLPNEDLSNIKPGDLLFIKNVLNYDPVKGFMNIEHTAIFAYWESDGMMRAWEVGSEPALGQYLLSDLLAPDDESLPRPERKAKIVLAARFPFAAKNSERKSITYSPGTIVSGNSTITYLIMKNLIPNRYYTFIGKMTWNKEIGDAYPAVFQMDDYLGSYEAATKKTDDDVYVIPIVPTNSADCNLRMLFNPNVPVAERQVNTRVEWFQVVEGIHHSRDKLSSDRYIQISLNSGFDAVANSRQNDRLVYAFEGEFEDGVTTVGTVSFLIRHGPFVPIISTLFVNNEPVDGVTAYLDYQSMSTCYLKVKNSTGEAVTGQFFCIIPINEY